MEFIETIRPFTLIAYYIFVTFVVILIILDNKKPEKSFAFIFLVLLVPIAGIIIYLLFGAQYQKKKLFTKKRCSVLPIRLTGCPCFPGWPTTHLTRILILRPTPTPYRGFF